MSLRIKFRSANIEQFIERYGVDVSRGGIFIRTREPLAVGTQLRFDFQLQDAAPLLAGEGTVVWIRENDPARVGVTPGMGLRFDKLTPASQPVLEKILSDKGKREQAGVTAKTSAAGGLAVRRPSSTFSALDPAAARAALTNAASRAPATGAVPRTGAPVTGPSALGAAPRAPAPATGSGPLSARTTGSRGVEPSAPGPAVPRESSGAFGRPRTSTGMNAARPAPAPQALFEKPTADDIDRALAVLTEVDEPSEGSDAQPAPVDFTARDTTSRVAVTEPPPRVRKATDAQPIVLESSPDVGDAPARRTGTGTRPLFSAAESHGKTVPVVTIGGVSPADEDEDATTAWAGSGPTRVSDDAPNVEPKDESNDEPNDEGSPPPVRPSAARVATATAETMIPQLAATRPAMAPVTSASSPATAHDLPAAPASAPPRPVVPVFTTAPPPKPRSAAPFVLAGLLVVGGGGFFLLKALKLLPSSASPTVAPATSEPAAAATASTASNQATPAAKTDDADAAVAPGSEAKLGEAKAGEAKLGEVNAVEDKPATTPAPATSVEAKPADGTATPATLRARPLGPPAEPPKEPTPEAKPAAKESSGGSHRTKHRNASSSEAAGVTDVSAPAPTGASGGDAAKEATTSNVLKITTSPSGAEVIVDGTSVGTTPFAGTAFDPAAPHAITLKKDGFESHERMISGSDWPRAKGGARTLKMNVKLHATGGAAGEPTKAAEPAAPTAVEPPGLGTTPASPKRE